ncbi:hypothetical protein [Bradyrhizobium sp.]|uniref:hypothetical protein n=1 Tax=Bradyrhizobium sp. TaxID=376 RepID=UPI002C98C2A3|nr:hypothetical protein [Bradyrhizobium sp.]HMM93137.1 hypothetical protein [Bradyrhizobium sp.]
MTLENSLSKARAAKISKTTPCKAAGGRRHSEKQLDTSGKSGAFFDYSEIRHAPVAPQYQVRPSRLRLKTLTDT